MHKYILLLIVVTTTMYGQSNKSKNPFQMVQVPDSIRYYLGSYIKQYEKIDTIYPAIYVYNLVQEKDYSFHDGIYYFRLMSPHSSGRIFIYNKSKIKIFESNYIDDLLEEYVNYIKLNQLAEETKVKYLKAITVFLNMEYQSRQ